MTFSWKVSYDKNDVIQRACQLCFNLTRLFFVFAESTTECDYVSSSYVEPAYCDVYYAGLPSTELLEEAMEQKPRKRSPGRPRKQRSNSDTSSDGEMQFSVPVGRKPGHGKHYTHFISKYIIGNTVD